MRRVSWATVLLVMMFVVVGGRLQRSTLVHAQTADQQAYFDALVKRPEHWKSLSLRDASQLVWKSNGGYGACSPTGCPEQLITYSPETDRDPHAQDAAKVRLPPFTVVPGGIGTLVKPMPTNPADPDYNWFYPKQISSIYIYRELKVDNEIMSIPYYRPGTTLPAYDTTNGRVYVVRGQFGTAVAAHAAGTVSKISNNGIGQAQLYFPLGTADGHTYVFTWDAYWTDSWLNNGLANMKTFNFTSPTTLAANQWAQIDTRLDDGPSVCTFSKAMIRGADIGTTGIRATNTITGPNGDWASTDGNRINASYGATLANPLCPIKSTFVLKPNRWTRYWLVVKQVANDYDPVDFWMADEGTDPVQIYANVPMSLRDTGIKEFWIEFNTSSDRYLRGSERDFVTYVRNFVALRDVADPRSLMARPLPGLVPAGTTAHPPAAPTNVRITN